MTLSDCEDGEGSTFREEMNTILCGSSRWWSAMSGCRRPEGGDGRLRPQRHHQRAGERMGFSKGYFRLTPDGREFFRMVLGAWTNPPDGDAARSAARAARNGKPRSSWARSRAPRRELETGPSGMSARHGDGNPRTYPMIERAAVPRRTRLLPAPRDRVAVIITVLAARRPGWRAPGPGAAMASSRYPSVI